MPGNSRAAAGRGGPRLRARPKSSTVFAQMQHLPLRRPPSIHVGPHVGGIGNGVIKAASGPLRLIVGGRSRTSVLARDAEAAGVGRGMTTARRARPRRPRRGHSPLTRRELRDTLPPAQCHPGRYPRRPAGRRPRAGQFALD